MRVDSEPGGVGAPEGRVGRQGEKQRQVHAHAVDHVDRLVGVVQPDVHVDAEDQLLARHELQPGDQVAVAGARDDPLVLPHRERVGPGRPDREAALAADLLDGGAERLEL